MTDAGIAEFTMAGGASGEAGPRATLFRLPALVLDFVNT